MYSISGYIWDFFFEVIPFAQHYDYGNSIGNVSAEGPQKNRRSQQLGSTTGRRTTHQACPLRFRNDVRTAEHEPRMDEYLLKPVLFDLETQTSHDIPQLKGE